MIAMIKLVPL